MDRKEAIEYAKFRLECYSKGDGKYTEHGEFLVAAIEALDKQIPFTPETNNLKVGLGRCKCGAEFLDKLTNYCGNCGQKLLWEAKE